MLLNEAWQLIRQTAADWVEDNAAQLGAALAFFSVLSLAPLLIIVIAIAGAVFGAEAARGEIVSQIDGMVGHDGAQVIQDILAHAGKPAEGALATALGIVTLLFGAAGVFGQLQTALNIIWEVRPSPRWVRGFFIARLLSFAMVLGTGFLLLALLALGALLRAVMEFTNDRLPGSDFVWIAANSIASFGLITLLFALVFKLIPDAKVHWKDVWPGATLTAILFTVGKFLLGLYLSSSGLGSAYGAAGSLVVLVAWVYYSALVLFFGAEFTHVYAQRYGAQIVPVEGAVHVTEGDNTTRN